MPFIIFTKYHGQEDLTMTIKNCDNTQKLPRLVRKLNETHEWFLERDQVMKEILQKKIDSMKEAIVNELAAHRGKILVAPVPYQAEKYWSCGLEEELASITDPKDLPGANQLGMFWQKLSEDEEFLTN